MQNKLNQFVGVRFSYNTLIYKVLEVKIVNQKATIKTDRRTFVFLERELDDFTQAIKFLEVKTSKLTDGSVEKSLEVQKIWSSENEGEKEVQLSPLQAEIIVAESNSSKVNAKLMDMFDLLSKKPTEMTFKQASAMVNVSNAIVSVQMAQFKFLSLKK